MADDGDDTGNETITLRVKDQTGDEMFFKVKKNTKMQVSLWRRCKKDFYFELIATYEGITIKY